MEVAADTAMGVEEGQRVVVPETQGVTETQRGVSQVDMTENRMDQNSLLKIPENPVRGIISTPTVLVGSEDVNHSAPVKRADMPNASLKIGLEEIMDRLQLESSSRICQVSKSMQQCPKKSSDIQLQYGDKVGKTYQDWRGVILPEIITPYTMLTNEEHQERLRLITQRKKFVEVQHPGMKPGGHQLYSKGTRRKPWRRAVTIVHEKVRRIGPHLEVFEAFGRIRKPSRKTAATAAINIQKFIRGYLERSRFQRIKLKAQHHGTTITAVVKEYRRMMRRIKRRCGILDVSMSLTYAQLEYWLDQKRFYEAMFSKRHYWEDMDVNELPKFFKDCGLFPREKDINAAVELVLTDAESKSVSVKKHQAVEMAFMLYPPHGLKLKTAATRKSTWVRPIIDGEDGYKYIVSGHPALKAADIQIAGDLVAASMRHWKERNLETELPCSLPSN